MIWFKKKEEDIPLKWKNRGLKTRQQVIDVMNEAFNNKEKLDSNIYIGKTKYGNICLCLDDNNKITDAFPAATTKENYINVKEKINKIGLGAPDEIHLQILSLFFCIDLLNNKDTIIEKINLLPQSFQFELFGCTITDDITVITTGYGHLTIGTNYVKNFILNNIIE